MDENARKKREWVKTAAIIFLSVMLVLTFFSNTIMNYSLPEVAIQYVQSGTVTAKIRGSGVVESGDPYNVEVKESRKVASVAVRVGDFVEKGDVILYLEDEESEELKTAQDALDQAWRDYEKLLLSETTTAAGIQAANSNTSATTFRQQITNAQRAVTDAEKRVDELQSQYNAFDTQIAITPENDADMGDLEEQLNDARTTLENATYAFTEANNCLDALKSEQTMWKAQLTYYEAIVNGNKDDDTPDTSDKDDNQPSGQSTITNLSEESNGLPVLDDSSQSGEGVNPLEPMNSTEPTAPSGAIEPLEPMAPTESTTPSGAIEPSEPIVPTEPIIPSEPVVPSPVPTLSPEEIKIEEAKKKIEEINIILDNLWNEIQVATNECNIRQAVQKEAKLAFDRAEAAFNNQTASGDTKDTIANLKRQQAAIKVELDRAKEILEDKKEALTELTGAITNAYGLQTQMEAITKAQEKVDELTEKSIGATVTADISGTITALNVVAGNTTSAATPVAVMQPEGKGFSMSFSVTNEQAKRLAVGDRADLVNAWRFDDVEVVLASIKPDPNDPGHKKLLTFDITGAVTAGQTLNISVGQKSANYDYIVPNNAIREDNNGKFILVVTSKSSPLGTRYVATRVDVEVLASDDNQSAVSSGMLTGYDPVITTSTKPVEAGKLVRLAENN